MIRPAMSPAASGLVRALIRRGSCPRDRILLSELQSTEWQSLTFVGERHRMELRIAEADGLEIARTIVLGLEDAEFALSGHIVADIRCTEEPSVEADGATRFCIEALTVED